MELDKINTREYMITFWVKDIKCEDIYSFFIETDFINKINKIVIGGVEKTENELEHFHCYIKLKNPMRLTTLKKKIGISSTHIEKVKTNLKECYEYCTKESCFYTNVLETDFNYELKEDDIYQKMITDIFENNFSIYECCKKYGKICVFHFPNVEKIINVREKEEMRQFNNRVFDEAFDFIE